MSFTVVINCYNSEQYLRATLSSVKKQSYTEFRLIFVNNHSTDSSVDIFHEAQIPNSVLLDTPEFLNLYDARNFALQYVDTEFIAFLDADDLWSTNYLEEMHRQHYTNPLVNAIQSRVCSFGVNRTNKCLTTKLQHLQYITPDYYSSNPFTALSGTTFKAHIFQQYQFPRKTDFIGDLDLILNMAAKKEISYIDTCITYYRIHPGGLTSSRLDQWSEELGTWLSTNHTYYPASTIAHLKQSCNYIEMRSKLPMNPISLFRDSISSKLLTSQVLKLQIRNLYHMLLS